MAGMNASRRSWLVLAAVFLAYAVYFAAYWTHASGLLRHEIVLTCVYVMFVVPNLLAIGVCAYGGRDTAKRRLPDWLCIACILLPVAFLYLDGRVKRLATTAAISRAGGYAAIAQDCRKLLRKVSELGFTGTSSFYVYDSLMTPDMPALTRLRKYGWSLDVTPSHHAVGMTRDRRDQMAYYYSS